LQTYIPMHPVMKALLSGDKDQFIDNEINARREAMMPPFGRLVALIVSGPMETNVDFAAQALAKSAPRGPNITVLGPAPAPIAILRGRHRRRLLFKATKETAVQPLIRQWISRAVKYNKVRIQIDVDPMSFF
jgi:primosomal protein N' (replication factor Y)